MLLPSSATKYRRALRSPAVLISKRGLCSALLEPTFKDPTFQKQDRLENLPDSVHASFNAWSPEPETVSSTTPVFHGSGSTPHVQELQLTDADTMTGSSSKFLALPRLALEKTNRPFIDEVRSGRGLSFVRSMAADLGGLCWGSGYK